MEVYSHSLLTLTRESALWRRADFKCMTAALCLHSFKIAGICRSRRSGWNRTRTSCTGCMGTACCMLQPWCTVQSTKLAAFFRHPLSFRLFTFKLPKGGGIYISTCYMYFLLLLAIAVCCSYL